MTASHPPVEPDSPSPLMLAKTEMIDGEKLIWADRSSVGSARRRVLPLSMLGWLFLVLVLAWIAKAAIASFWLLIMGLPFFVAAIALALLPWWWPSITRHTIYAISDQRLLIIRNWPRRRVTSYGPEEIDVIERRERKDGSGDLIFRHEEHPRLRHHHDHGNKRRMSERPVGFFGVPDVRRLEEAVWALKQRSKSDLHVQAFNELPRPSSPPPNEPGRLKNKSKDENFKD